MNTENIKAIFTNLLFVIGVALVIVGFVRGALTVTRMFVFEKYPLNYYDEARCDINMLPAKAVEPATVDNGKSNEQSIKECKIALEHERRVRMVEDIVISVTTLISGVVLVYSFKKFIFR